MYWDLSLKPNHVFANKILYRKNNNLIEVWRNKNVLTEITNTYAYKPSGKNIYIT